MTQDEIVAARGKVKDFKGFVFSLMGYHHPGFKKVNKLRDDGVDLADILTKTLDALETAKTHNEKLQGKLAELYNIHPELED